MSEPQEQRWHRLHDHVVHGLRGAGHCTSPMRTTSTRPGPMCHVLATRASPVAYVARSRVRRWIERVEFRSGAVAGRPPGGSEGLLSSSAQSGDPGPARRGCAGRVPGTVYAIRDESQDGRATRPGFRREQGGQRSSVLGSTSSITDSSLSSSQARQIAPLERVPSKIKTLLDKTTEPLARQRTPVARLRTRTRVSMIVPTAATA